MAWKMVTIECVYLFLGQDFKKVKFIEYGLKYHSHKWIYHGKYHGFSHLHWMEKYILNGKTHYFNGNFQ